MQYTGAYLRRKFHAYHVPPRRIPQVYSGMILNFSHMDWLTGIDHGETNWSLVSIQTLLQNELHIVGGRCYIAKQCHTSVLFFLVQVIFEQSDRCTNNL